jgi:NRPS condensation-like uncharacterized protein
MTQLSERENVISLSKRKLGLMETSMAMSQKFADGTTQGALVITLRGEITYRSLRAAAELVFKKYKLLRCMIETYQDDLYFVEHNDFSRIAISYWQVASFNDWEKTEGGDLHDTIDQSVALWRLSLLSNSDNQHKIILALHHAIVDADAAKAVVRDLLNFADSIMRGKAVAFDELGIPPAVDDFLPPYYGASQNNVVKCNPIPYHIHSSLEGRRTHFLHDKLSISDYAFLLDKCKKDHISIDSAFSAALSLAAVSSGIAHPPVSFRTAVSLREYAATKRTFMNELGCYIAVADTTLDVKDQDFLLTANEYYKKLLAHTISHSLKRKNISTVDVFNNIESMKEGKNFSGFGITNVGEMNPAAEFECYSVEDVYNITNRVAGNHAFVLQVSTFKGEPRFIFAYVEPLLQRHVIEKLCEHFKRHLVDYYGDCL